METKEVWNRYYQQAVSRTHNKRTEYAVKLNQTNLNVAVDCGCGTGSDMAYLSSCGYQAYGFDNNSQAIDICHGRFENDDSVVVENSSFDDFEYPKTGILIANHSLYFADPITWETTWPKMVDSIQPGGVFVGDFMGMKDSWANKHRSVTLPLKFVTLRLMFDGFDVVQLDERDELGKTALGKTKHWHTYSVIAVKQV